MSMQVPVASALLFLTLLCFGTHANSAGLTLQDTCGRATSGVASKGDLNAAVLTTGVDGAVAVTDYSGSYAAIGDCEVLTTRPPVCALSASNTKVAKGSTVTLFAKCTLPTDSLTWNTPAGSPSLATSGVTMFARTVTLLNAGAYTYTVKGTSTSGTGAPSAPVTILVGNDTGFIDKPTCILTISPAPVEFLLSATASVVCQPEATSYSWDTAETNAPASPSSSTAQADLTFATPGTYTYKVAGVNSAGSGPKASATVTVATGINFRGYSSKTTGGGPGVLNFPAGTQPTDWLAMYSVTTGDLATPAGWTNAKKRALTNYAGVYANLFIRQAGSDTSVTVPPTAIIVAYEGGSGFGAAVNFYESTPTAGNCNVTAVRETAGGVVINFYTDADGTQASPPVGYTSRVALAGGANLHSIADRFYGSTGSTPAGWAQVGTPNHSAYCTLIELKR